MDLVIVDDYPGDASHGADFLTGASKGTIFENRPDGTIERPERIVVTDRMADFDGRVCIGEKTARHLAHLFGCVDGWRVDLIKADNVALRAELVALSKDLAKLRTENEVLRSLDRDAPDRVYLAVDNSEHASARAAVEATALLCNLQPRMLLDAIAAPPQDVAPVSVPATEGSLS